jgi:hypothetical protein
MRLADLFGAFFRVGLSAFVSLLLWAAALHLGLT